MEPRVTSLQLWVKDLEASAKFYGGFLGFVLGEPHRHAGNEALHYDLAWGDFETGNFMMLHLAEADGRPPSTGAQIGFSGVDLEALHARAVALAIPVVEPPHDDEWGRNAKYEDPDHNVVSVG